MASQAGSLTRFYSACLLNNSLLQTVTWGSRIIRSTQLRFYDHEQCRVSSSLKTKQNVIFLKTTKINSEVLVCLILSSIRHIASCRIFTVSENRPLDSVWNITSILLSVPMVLLEMTVA